MFVLVHFAPTAWVHQTRPCRPARSAYHERMRTTSSKEQSSSRAGRKPQRHAKRINVDMGFSSQNTHGEAQQHRGESDESDDAPDVAAIASVVRERLPAVGTVAAASGLGLLAASLIGVGETIVAGVAGYMAFRWLAKHNWDPRDVIAAVQQRRHTQRTVNVEASSEGSAAVH